MGGGSASTCNLHYFLNFLLYILVISNLFLFAVQNFRCFSRHFYSFFYFVFCLRSIGGIVLLQTYFFLSTNLLLHIIRSPVYITSIFIYFFLCCIFLLFIRTFFLFLYIIKICIYVCIYVRSFYIFHWLFFLLYLYIPLFLVLFFVIVIPAFCAMLVFVFLLS